METENISDSQARIWRMRTSRKSALILTRVCHWWQMRTWGWLSIWETAIWQSTCITRRRASSMRRPRSRFSSWCARDSPWNLPRMNRPWYRLTQTSTVASSLFWWATRESTKQSSLSTWKMARWSGENSAPRCSRARGPLFLRLKKLLDRSQWTPKSLRTTSHRRSSLNRTYHRKSKMWWNH